HGFETRVLSEHLPHNPLGPSQPTAKQMTNRTNKEFDRVSRRPGANGERGKWTANPVELDVIDTKRSGGHPHGTMTGDTVPRAILHADGASICREEPIAARDRVMAFRQMRA